jgi:luciferase family oxidoreductase group 1
MLPNHTSLVVAEQFGMLEALHPDRIDLGIGRAPGTDAITARALRRSMHALSVDEFPQQLGELFGFFTGNFPAEHPYRQITAVPGLGYQPAIWLLGSSDYSAEVAGLLGLPFSFAHHFAAANTLPALDAYRRNFRPSAVLERPYAMVAVSVLCADDDERAERLAKPGAVSFVRRRTGRPGPLPSPEEAADYQFTPFEREAVRSWTSTHIVGGPERVGAGLQELVDRTAADELMITTMVYDHADRLRSYELVSQLAPVAAGAAAPAPATEPG